MSQHFTEEELSSMVGGGTKHFTKEEVIVMEPGLAQLARSSLTNKPDEEHIFAPRTFQERIGLLLSPKTQELLGRPAAQIPPGLVTPPLPMGLGEELGRRNAEMLSGMTSPLSVAQLGVSALSPPVGLGLFAAQALEGVKPSVERTVKEFGEGNFVKGVGEAYSGLLNALPALGLLGLRAPAFNEQPIAIRNIPALEQPPILGQPRPRVPRQLPAPEQPSISEQPGVPDQPRTPEQPFRLEAPFLLRSRKGLGLNPATKVEGQQLFNRLKNKLAPGELELLDRRGLSDFLNEPRTPEEVAGWIERGGLEVETHAYGMAREKNEVRAEFDRLDHEIDTARSGWSAETRDWAAGAPWMPKDETEVPELVKEAISYGMPERDARIFARYLLLQGKITRSDTGPQATSAYETVSAFPTNEPMPEWTTSKYNRNVQRVDVVLSQDRVEGEVIRRENVIWQPDGLHEHFPNTLGWAMVQYVTGPKGERVALINEAQSRWGQSVRKLRGSGPRSGQTRLRQIDHPLVRDYGRLVLKAAIDQARKEGATHIVLSDAETAMMTEGHDLRFDTVRGVSQESGMRLNYDTILPRILEELTGSKGERVNLGEHKNAFDPQSQPFIGESPEQTAIRQRGVPRQDLVFQEPTGEPKTSITGQLYPLNKAKKSFSLFGSDKPTTKKGASDASRLREDQGPLPVDAGPERQAEILRQGSEEPRGQNLERVPPRQPGPSGGEEAPPVLRPSPGVPATIASGPPVGPPRPPRYYGPGGEDLGGGPPIPPGRTPIGNPGSELNPRTFGQSARAIYNAVANRSIPNTTAVSRQLATALFEYANARRAAETLGTSMATDVLGSLRYKDARFDRLLAAVIVEDDLRATRRAKEAAGDLRGAAAVRSLIGRKGSPLGTQEDFLAALSNPDIRAAIRRHKGTIQPFAKQMHESLGGRLAPEGDITGAFVNFIAVDEEGRPLSTDAFVTGKGDLTAPRQRTTRFSRHREGTGEYDLSYRRMAERMIRANYVEVMKQRLENEYVAQGVGVILRSEDVPPKGYTKFEIKRKGTRQVQTYVQNLWIRNDLESEFRDALKVDGPPQKSALRTVGQLVTKAQVMLGTDAVIHSVNVFGGVNGIWRARGHTSNLVGFREMDTIARITRNLYRSIRNTPDVQREIAEMTRYNVGRDKTVESTIGTRSLGSLALEWIDRAGRLSMNELWNEAVREGPVVDDPLDRFQYMEQLGQYNETLMDRLQRMFRESGISPFIVAGRTMNNLAVKRLLGSPGMKGVDAAASARMRAETLIGFGTAVFAVPLLLNKYLTGQWTGRPGTPIGDIDTGKDDDQGRHITVSPGHWLLLDRGYRITGARAAVEGLRQGQSWKEIRERMIRDITSGFGHPFIGPFVNALSLGVSGHDVFNYKSVEEPEHFLGPRGRGEGLLKTANPTIENIMKAGETEPVIESIPGRVEAAMQDLGARAIGVKHLKPSPEQQLEEISQRMTGKAPAGLSVEERRQVMEEMKKAPGAPKTLAEKRKVAERATQHSFERAEETLDVLSSDNRKFVKGNKLILPTYRTSQTVEGVALPMTRSERDFMAREIARRYGEAIDRLRQDPNFGNLRQEAKQYRLNAILNAARQRAEAALAVARRKGELKNQPRNNFSVNQDDLPK